MQELQQVEIKAGTAVRITQLAFGIQQAQRAYGDAIVQALSVQGKSVNGNPWDLKIDGEQAFLVEMGERADPKAGSLAISREPPPDSGGEDGEEATED